MTEKSKIDTFDFCAGVAMPFLLVAWLAPISLLRAWTVTKLWGWYVVPGFGVPPIHMSLAFGLGILIGCLMPFSAKSDRKWYATLLLPVGNAFFALLLGWIGTFWM